MLFPSNPGAGVDLLTWQFKARVQLTSDKLFTFLASIPAVSVSLHCLDVAKLYYTRQITKFVTRCVVNPQKYTPRKEIFFFFDVWLAENATARSSKGFLSAVGDGS